MSIESELYNLKMKILKSKHISDQLREELANDVFEIESSIQAKNNEVLDLVSKPLYEFDRFVYKNYPNDYYTISTMIDFFSER